MSKKTTEIYEKFAEKALTYLNSTEAFLKEQLPDYFQQIVSYYAVENWVYFGVWILIATAFAGLAFVCVREVKKDDDYIGGVILFTLVSLVLFVCSLDSFSSALKATIAPKVFIVDYLRGKE